MQEGYESGTNKTNKQTKKHNINPLNACSFQEPGGSPPAPITTQGGEQLKTELQAQSRARKTQPFALRLLIGLEDRQNKPSETTTGRKSHREIPLGWQTGEDEK